MLKFAILGMLAQAPAYGYEIKRAFEAMLGHTWPVNIGQIYSTLARLERDGLVTCEEVSQELLPNRKVCTITEAGRAALVEWLQQPAAPSARLRVDFYLKLLLAYRSHAVDLTSLIWQQRQTLLQALADLTPLLTAQDESLRLLAEGLQLHLEADLRWLDRCEEVFGASTEGGAEA